jgi:hypothetical protein
VVLGSCFGFASLAAAFRFRGYRGEVCVPFLLLPSNEKRLDSPENGGMWRLGRLLPSPPNNGFPARLGERKTRRILGEDTASVLTRTWIQLRVQAMPVSIPQLGQ